MVAVLTAILLSPGDVLCDDPVSLNRDQRRRGRLGEIGTEGDGRARNISVYILKTIAARAASR